MFVAKLEEVDKMFEMVLSIRYLIRRVEEVGALVMGRNITQVVEGQLSKEDFTYAVK